ncbi:MAG: protein-L-isoaspartate(D-aspartate) O-methyltransferase [Flavobacteriales bacterium]|nr:protein-L-isoaspartate(D-aspartate) O-methyltransferase [Flavobacteriales bacterium]
MLTQNDTYRHKGLRKLLIQELRESGISNENVLEAMNTIPRHYFMEGAFLEYAYDNKAFQIGAGQTISQPYTVAFQTQLLQLEKGEKVLEIGTGSGYQTSVLCELGAKVVSIERQRLLYDNARLLIPTLGYRPRLFYGDGFKGKEAFGPYDKVLITCGAPFIPEALIHQTKIGGRLVIPLGEGDVQEMILLEKISETEIRKSRHGKFSFVPMLENRATES